MNKLVNFLNSENFENVNDGYSNFIPKLIEVIDKVAPVKNKTIKKKEVFKNKLTECIGKPKDLWKALQSLT